MLGLVGMLCNVAEDTSRQRHHQQSGLGYDAATSNQGYMMEGGLKMKLRSREAPFRIRHGAPLKDLLIPLTVQNHSPTCSSANHLVVGFETQFEYYFLEASMFMCLRKYY